MRRELRKVRIWYVLTWRCPWCYSPLGCVGSHSGIFTSDT